jgi:hypothetical protein
LQADIPFTHRTHGRGTNPTGHIVVAVRLGDSKPHAFLLDTGAPSTTVLMPREVLSIDAVARSLSDNSIVFVQGLTGTDLPAYRVATPSVTVGRARVSNLTYLMVPMPANSPSLGDSAYGPIMGVLGNDFLSKFTVTIDYDRSVISLTPRSQTPTLTATIAE